MEPLQAEARPRANVGPRRPPGGLVRSIMTPAWNIRGTFVEHSWNIRGTFGRGGSRSRQPYALRVLAATQ